MKISTVRYLKDAELEVFVTESKKLVFRNKQGYDVVLSQHDTEVLKDLICLCKCAEVL